MRHFLGLFVLPASLLVLLTTTAIHAEELEWPYNLPSTMKYHPEDEAHIARDLALRQQLSRQAPLGMRKMSGDDEGEKFYMHYWDFGEQPESPAQQSEYRNSTLERSALFAAIAPHTTHNGLHFGRSLFSRSFQCPTDTNVCSALNSDLCCPTTATCVSIGSRVGCCPSGDVCETDILSCAAGYSSCPNDVFGGCCVPGASCEGTGCVLYGTQTVVVTLPTATVTAGSGTTSTGAVVPIVATSVATSVLVSGYTTTATVTVTQTIGGQLSTVVQLSTIVQSTTIIQLSTIAQPTTVVVVPASVPTTAATSTSTTTVTSQSSLTCSAGFQSCAASLGGGCCSSGLICGTGTACLSPSTSTTTTTTGATAVAPIRPTTVSTTTSLISTVASSSATDETCPTGYYVCQAYYLGGCCRVGRDCDTTSCPSSDSTSVVATGVTVVVPGTATTTGADSTSTGSCANGWFLCGADTGSGCCPSGHVCGTQSCTATASGVGDTAKVAPSSASMNQGFAWSFVALGLTAGIGMIWL